MKRKRATGWNKDRVYKIWNSRNQSWMCEILCISLPFLSPDFSLFIFQAVCCRESRKADIKGGWEVLIKKRTTSLTFTLPIIFDSLLFLFRCHGLEKTDRMESWEVGLNGRELMEEWGYYCIQCKLNNICMSTSLKGEKERHLCGVFLLKA